MGQSGIPSLMDLSPMGQFIFTTALLVGTIVLGLIVRWVFYHRPWEERGE